jgi:aminoglycoside phosphotransferase family enzyme
LQLQSKDFDKNTELQNLAHQIAQMHKNLPELSQQEQRDILEVLQNKWQLNQTCFLKALKRIESSSLNAQSLSLCSLMSHIQKKFGKKIQQRQNKVKRYHGDLKTNNIWLVGEQFNVLDCVDFQTDFCNIDTLSDVAMLIMDLEAQLSQLSNLSSSQTQSLLNKFIRTYLSEMNDESDFARLLLEYYIIEKAIVCAYMCILFDSEYNYNLLKQGEKYLEIAQKHANQLMLLVRKNQPSKSVKKYNDRLMLIAKNRKTKLPISAQKYADQLMLLVKNKRSRPLRSAKKRNSFSKQKAAA